MNTILNMRVQTDIGEPVAPDDFVPIDAVPSDPNKYPFLSSIDPYDETVFNPTQCQRLVAEWDRQPLTLAGKDKQANSGLFGMLLQSVLPSTFT
jgi:hypothetical protein